MKEYYQAKVKITEATDEEIKLKTKAQENGDHFQVWLAERRKILTAQMQGLLQRGKLQQK